MGVGLGLSSQPSMPLGMESQRRASGQGCADMGEILGKGLSPDLPCPELPVLQALDPTWLHSLRLLQWREAF